MAPTKKDRAVLKTRQSSSTHTISIKEEQCGKTNGRKPGRACSFCHQYFHLTCVSPKLSKITSAILTTWMCSNCTNLPICNLPISSKNQTQVTTFGKSSSNTIISSSRFLQGYCILLKIPKGTRVLVAETLVETIDGALNDPNNSLNLEKLFNFAKLILAVPRNPDSASKPNLSLNSIIRSNIAGFRQSKSPTRHQLARPVKPFSGAFDEKTQLCKRVNAKLIEGDVSAIINPTYEVMDALRLKHPPTPSDFRPPPSLFDDLPTTNPNEVLAALRSFPPSSSAELDGLRP